MTDLSKVIKELEALGIHDCVLIANGHQSYEVLRKVTDNVVYTLKEVTL